MADKETERVGSWHTRCQNAYRVFLLFAVWRQLPDGYDDMPLVQFSLQAPRELSISLYFWRKGIVSLRLFTLVTFLHGGTTDVQNILPEFHYLLVS